MPQEKPHDVDEVPVAGGAVPITVPLAGAGITWLGWHASFLQRPSVVFAPGPVFPAHPLGQVQTTGDFVQATLAMHFPSFVFSLLTPRTVESNVTWIEPFEHRLLNAGVPTGMLCLIIAITAE
ncbi:MAG: hypothetical protein B7Y36_10510 [Novosphingobium sp. 28-62-57]|nr:MAG: hypothetical protein B7Z34_12930 [Novosphingobium sp. 12-62-10]OYZ10177.1 MAG: hypothetical protein B7Y36_10510 [Novosphingobium sp. 28-62-57]OZA33586.1 MAG: hypothetical protein B7X92_11160 [Novosphingobium sp. 17-62-9]